MPTVYTETGKVIESLEPLFKKAEEEGLWFFCSYQQLWFSPKQLRNAHSEGRFLWGALNWSLRDPQEKLAELKEEISTAKRELKAFQIQMDLDSETF